MTGGAVKASLLPSYSGTSLSASIFCTGFSHPAVGHFALASHAMNAVELDGYFKALVPDPIDGDPTRARNIRTELHRLFEEGRGQDIPGIRYTTWAAVNAVTEFVDHHRGTRGTDSLDRSRQRLQSAWFGQGAAMKGRAWNLALEVATAA